MISCVIILNKYHSDKILETVLEETVKIANKLNYKPSTISTVTVCQKRKPKLFDCEERARRMFLDAKVKFKPSIKNFT